MISEIKCNWLNDKINLRIGLYIIKNNNNKIKRMIR